MLRPDAQVLINASLQLHAPHFDAGWRCESQVQRVSYIHGDRPTVKPRAVLVMRSGCPRQPTVLRSLRSGRIRARSAISHLSVRMDDSEEEFHGRCAGP